MSENELALAGAGFDRLMDVEEDETPAKTEEPESEGDSALPPAASYPGL